MLCVQIPFWVQEREHRSSQTKFFKQRLVHWTPNDSGYFAMPITSLLSSFKNDKTWARFMVPKMNLN